jgi:ribonuclease P protein component
VRVGSRTAITPQALGPRERLKRRQEFDAVFAGGTRTHGRFMTLLLLPNDVGRSRLGVVASRKLGGAVERNRAKRLVRQLFRTHKPAAGGVGYDVVVIPRRELLVAAYATLESDYRSIFRRQRLAGR